MTNEQILQALKDNTSAFGLMGKNDEERKAMQDKAIEIGLLHFSVWSGNRTHGYCWKLPAIDFNPSFSYRLRSDYAEESEKIEFEKIEYKVTVLCPCCGKHIDMTLACKKVK